MVNKYRFRRINLMLADLGIFYLSLILTLEIRNTLFGIDYSLDTHFFAFSLIFAIWLLIFYIAGLYEVEHFLSLKELRGRIFNTMLSSGAVAIVIFYIIPAFGITPKTILILDSIITTFFVWVLHRWVFIFAKERIKLRVFFVKDSEGEIGKKELDLFKKLLEDRPQLGYRVVNDQEEAQLVILSEESRKNKEIIGRLYSDIFKGKTVLSFSNFYEAVVGKVPVYSIDKGWFLENLIEINKGAFETFKRMFDILLSLVGIFFTLAITPLVAIAIKATSSGPIFFRQKRVGKRGKIFELIKFRSMTVDAESGEYKGWTKLEANDKRITFIGKILRKTRIDELPQFWNILKGEMSIVGPRPERPEFVMELEKQIPHYTIRQIVKPGVTGWGQIYFSTASANDALEKLQYDLYYIKNRSLALEVGIILKTIFILFRREGR